jgi:hypothetical protein
MNNTDYIRPVNQMDADRINRHISQCLHQLADYAVLRGRSDIASVLEGLDNLIVTTIEQQSDAPSERKHWERQVNEYYLCVERLLA